ncbi:MAG: toxin-antitoxin system TumE family protein [Burkholderiales bacterium]
MRKATLLLGYKARQGDLIVQLVVWQLPAGAADRIKFRLYLGRAGKTLVRYDNEAGKGAHRHVGTDEVEAAYEFTSVERLIEDFRAECEQHGWRWEE